MSDQYQQELQMFEALWQAVQLLQEAIGYSYVEALGETLQNLVMNNQAQQVEGQPSDSVIQQLNERYQQLQLPDASPESIRRIIQLTFLKASKADGLQTNHQMTPDAIGLLLAFMVDQLTPTNALIRIADFASGSGNLLSTVLLFLQQAKKTVQATAIDNDEVLVHLALQAFALEKLDVSVLLQDGLSDLLVDPLTIAISDLPVGYYPVDEHAKTFQTRRLSGHSFAHHLLIEQHVRYLQEAGIGLMIVPTAIFDTPEGATLLTYLQQETFVQAMLAFPKNLFKDQQFSKSLLIFQKKGKGAKQVRQVLLGDIPEFKHTEKFKKFIQTFEKWSQEMV